MFCIGRYPSHGLVYRDIDPISGNLSTPLYDKSLTILFFSNFSTKRPIDCVLLGKILDSSDVFKIELIKILLL